MEKMSIYSDEYGIPLSEGKIKELTIDKEPIFWEDFLVPVKVIKDGENGKDHGKDSKDVSKEDKK